MLDSCLGFVCFHSSVTTFVCLTCLLSYRLDQSVKAKSVSPESAKKPVESENVLVNSPVEVRLCCFTSIFMFDLSPSC